MWEGCDEGGEMDVTSREGERARLLEDWELGDGVSSGGGGGGRTKWNVRDAICIWDLNLVLVSRRVQGLVCRPFSQRGPRSTTRPYTVDPGTVATDNNENKAVFVLVVLNLRVKTRNALESPEININNQGFCCGRRGSVWVGRASTTDGNRECLNIECEMGEDQGIVRRYLLLWRRRVLLLDLKGRDGGCRTSPDIHNYMREGRR